jgi:DNA polymerase-3 subunit alpha/error-prone DNA polymerase
MLSFDGYSFCKPHSASYAMVSFQSAFLRVHHPAEFIAAVLSNQGGFYCPRAYISEARRMKLEITGPDVNLSQWKYYGKSCNHEKSVFIGEVFIGFMAIKGLSVSGAKVIFNERKKGGDFSSLNDFSRRVKLNRDDIIALCPAGVFDSISDGLTRSLQARRLLAANYGKSKGGQEELFSSDVHAVYEFRQKTVIAPKEKKVNITDDDLWGEYRALGFLRNLHPLALWKDDILAVKYRVKALRIADYVGQYVRMVGWPITQKDVWTKDGLTMCFLSLEDETAMYETVVFPEVYDKYNRLLFDQKPLLVYGRVTDDNGAISLEIHKIEALGRKNAGEAFALRFAAGSF